jgi:hypothetical protein
VPFPLAVVVVVSVNVVVVAVLVVGEVVLVGGGVVVLAGGAGVNVVVGTEVAVDVVVLPPPLSAAITTSATRSPITIATRMAIAHFKPELTPPLGGWGGGAGGSGCPM